MKRFFSWSVSFGLVLVALSILFYVLHYLIFRDAHHIFLYLVGDIAFLFFDVLIVMMVLQRLLAFREKQSMLKKLNMVIGAFFSEVGTELLAFCARYDSAPANVSKQLIVTAQWSDADFKKACQIMAANPREIDKTRIDFTELKQFIVSKRSFLLSLLGNPNLLEHQKCTNLLWAVLHLAEELSHRDDVSRVSEPDALHLAGDIKRAYNLLVVQWLDYMQHLRCDYPYLFSLALRTNPFDPNASVEVR